MSGPKITVLTDTSGEATVKHELNELNREFARLELAGRDANRTLTTTGGTTDRFAAGIKAAAGPGGLQGLSAGLMSVAPQAAAIAAGLAAAKKEAEEFAAKSRVLSEVLAGLKGDQEGLTDSVARFIDAGAKAASLNEGAGKDVGGFIGTALGGPEAWVSGVYSAGIDVLTDAITDTGTQASWSAKMLEDFRRQKELIESSTNASENAVKVAQWNRENDAIRAQAEALRKAAEQWTVYGLNSAWAMQHAATDDWGGITDASLERDARTADVGLGRGRGGGRRQGPRTAELFELGSGRSTGPQWGGGDDPSAFATGLDAVTTALGDMSAALLANAEDAKTWSDLSAAAHLHTERVATQSAAAQQAALMATYKATVGYTSATIGMVRTGVAGFLSEGAPKELFLGGADLAMAATATAEAFLMPTPGTVAAIGAYLFSSAQHFAMASQAGKGGAGARPSGGGGGGSSRPVTPAPVPRERSQSPAETILQLMVDDRVLGEVAARGNNRALAMGRGEALDSRLIGRARRGGI